MCIRDRFKITEGNRILRSHGIYTRYWMAPNHSFDDTTLRALVDTGFTAISDGIALFPYTYAGLVFVPQQTWRPRWMPCGVQTICLHTNTVTVAEIKRLRAFLRKPNAVSQFSEVVNNHSQNPAHRAADLAFQTMYHATWKFMRPAIAPLKAVRRPHRTVRQLGSKPPQPSHLGS